jgi:hypothetical protein
MPESKGVEEAGEDVEHEFALFYLSMVREALNSTEP